MHLDLWPRHEPWTFAFAITVFASQYFSVLSSVGSWRHQEAYPNAENRGCPLLSCFADEQSLRTLGRT